MQTNIEPLTRRYERSSPDCSPQSGRPTASSRSGSPRCSTALVLKATAAPSTCSASSPRPLPPAPPVHHPAQAAHQTRSPTRHPSSHKAQLPIAWKCSPARCPHRYARRPRLRRRAPAIAVRARHGRDLPGRPRFAPSPAPVLPALGVTLPAEPAPPDAHGPEPEPRPRSFVRCPNRLDHQGPHPHPAEIARDRQGRQQPRPRIRFDPRYFPFRNNRLPALTRTHAQFVAISQQSTSCPLHRQKFFVSFLKKESAFFLKKKKQKLLSI